MLPDRPKLSSSLPRSIRKHALQTRRNVWSWLTQRKGRRLSTELREVSERRLTEIASEQPSLLAILPARAGSLLDKVGKKDRLNVVILNDRGFCGTEGTAARSHAVALASGGCSVAVVAWTCSPECEDLRVFGQDVSHLWRGCHSLERSYTNPSRVDIKFADIIHVVRQLKPDLVIAGELGASFYPKGVIDHIRSLGIAVLNVETARADPLIGVDHKLFAAIPKEAARRLVGVSARKPLVILRAPGHGDTPQAAALFDGVRRALGRRRDVAVICFAEQSASRLSAGSYGCMPYHALPFLLNSADVYISTSVSPLADPTLLKAMACGLPVVAAAAAPLRAIVTSGENGLLAEQLSPDSLVSAAQTLLADATLRSNLGSNARRQIEENFTLSHARQAWAALLNRIDA